MNKLTLKYHKHIFIILIKKLNFINIFRFLHYNVHQFTVKMDDISNNNELDEGKFYYNKLQSKINYFLLYLN